jgi:hypothetical protein
MLKSEAIESGVTGPAFFSVTEIKRAHFLACLFALTLAPAIKFPVSRHLHKDHRVPGNLPGNFGMLQDVPFQTRKSG